MFAYDSIDPETLAESIDSRHRTDELPYDSRIDSVCILDRGVICNQLVDGKLNALPEPESKICFCKTEQSLLLFYTLIAGYFHQASLPDFRFVDYVVGNIKVSIKEIE